MKNNWLINIQLIVLFFTVIFLYSFTSKRNENRKISQPEIEIENKNCPLLTSEIVNKLLIENLGSAFNITKEKLALKKIEQSLNSHHMVASSEVYVSVNGKVKASIKQKLPIARVNTNFASYYIDYEGSKILLSENFSARVPLVSGNVNTTNKKQLVQLLQQIFEDTFLKKNIIGVQVLDDNSLILKNRNYSFDIVFGRPIQIEKKLKNYEAFFQKAVQDTLLEKYKKINLKFTKQVVCTK